MHSYLVEKCKDALEYHVLFSQGWSLDSCMDEKSKATIEKMLLEEQYPLFFLM